MASGMTTLMVAVGGVSLVGYLLMNRGQARKTRRQSAESNGDSPGCSEGSGGGWSLLPWLGSDGASSDASSSSSDGGGSDGGGGGGDGGGGSD
jgi:hypothetical protein